MSNTNCPDCGNLFNSRPTGRGTPRQRCEPCTAAFQTARAAARTAQKRAIQAGDLDAEMIFHADVYTRDNWVCHICGSEVPESSRQHSRLVFGEYDPLAPTVDHIVALAVGGKHTMSNVATAHHKCNQSKGSKETAGRLPGKPARGVKQAPVPFRTCTLHGCGQQHRRRGLCSSHAYREDRYGHPLAASCVCGCGETMTVTVDHFGAVAIPGHGGNSQGGALTVAEQLAQKVRLQPVSDHGISIGLTDDCHIWTGTSNKHGYGMLSDYYTGRKGVAHRFAYVLAHGKESVAGKVVDHLCRVPGCVNVNHLEAVTNQENTLRGHAVRDKAPDWHERRLGHPFNPEPGHFSGRGRRCLTCRGAAEQERNLRTLCPAGRHPWPDSRGTRDCKGCALDRHRDNHADVYGHTYVIDLNNTGSKYERCLICRIDRAGRETCPQGHIYGVVGRTTLNGCAECNRIRARANSALKRVGKGRRD